MVAALALAVGVGVAGPARADASSDLVARGEYLTRAANCMPCHTAPGGQPFAGGLPFKLPFGTLYAPNITPDAETGIGTWSDDDFVRAMHEGIAKDGTRLYPAFPYASYTLLSRDDVLAVKAYLFSLKPVKHTPPPNDLKFPFNQRWTMIFWDWLYNPDRRFQPDSSKSPAWNRGAYMVEALGHCGECHTPRNFLQATKSDQKFAGTVILGWRAYNITPDPQTGIGRWSEGELAEYLASGTSDGHGVAAGPMGEVTENSLRYLTHDDIEAMTTYLRSVPPIASGPMITAPPQTAQATPPQEPSAADAERIHADPGLRMFAGACVGCHGWDGRGLAGTAAVSDPTALNLTHVVLEGVHLKAAEVDMPEFGKGYSDAEVASLADYVTGRFGGHTASVTPDDVAKRRSGD